MSHLLFKQRKAQHILHIFHKVEFEAFYIACIDFFDVLAVLFRNQDVCDTRTFCSKDFSFMPPTGSTFPRSVISPVMAMWSRTRRCVSAEAMEVAIVIPADGPSLA